jgi:putative transposase
VRYAFIRAHSNKYAVRFLCRVLGVHPSGYYRWLKHSESSRDRENRRLTGLIKQSWLESGGVYGYRKVHDDLRCMGERCGKHRVLRLMKREGLKAQVGYKRRPWQRNIPSTQVPQNLVNQQFDVNGPNQVWVTDITYIRTYEGWLYLATVIDLYSRKVVGWSMQSRLYDELVINALLMAVWRRRPQQEVIIHSDQGTQYRSTDWTSFLKEHGLTPSMSRRGHCLDNAVAESFFQLLKRERIRKRVYPTREEARSDIFEYIELFYNSTRKHGYNNMLSPADYEQHLCRS